MPIQTSNYAVRSVSAMTKARLVALKSYSRLSYGALIDDAVEALWSDYIEEGHSLPEVEATRLGDET